MPYCDIIIETIEHYCDVSVETMDQVFQNDAIESTSYVMELKSDCTSAGIVWTIHIFLPVTGQSRPFIFSLHKVMTHEGSVIYYSH